MSELVLLTKLKTNLVNFLDELIESFPSEPDFVIFRIFVKDRIPMTDVMDYIVKNVCPFYEDVKNRNEKVLLENNILFEKFDQNKATKVSYFQKLWKSPNVDKEDKEVIWKWLQSFIEIGNAYKKLISK
mgnify:CR=1 FL=1